MDGSALLVAALAIFSVVAIVVLRLGLDLVGLLTVIALVAFGILTLDEALAGFANPTLIALAGLYVIGEGMTRTGALEFIARGALRLARGSELRLLFTLCYAAALVSTVVSDTAVVLVFLPIAMRLARDFEIPASRLLMPIGFSALLGGTVTLIGSSTNLIASSAAERVGAAPMGMYEMTPIALPLALIGVGLMVLLCRRLLPDRASMTASLAAAPAREYVTELLLGPTSPLIGKSVAESFGEPGVRPLFLVRDEEVLWPPFEGLALRGGDVVMLQGHVGQMADLQGRLGAKLVGNVRFDSRTMRYFELAVSPQSLMVGRRISDLQLDRDYGVYCIAVLREGRHVRERASGLVLRPGDLLLVCGEEDSEARMRASTDFFLLTGAQEWVVLRGLARRALAILVAVVLLFSFGQLLGLRRFLPLPFVSVLGAVAMVASGCLTARRAYRAIEWPVLLFVVGTLALGEAMRVTGLAAACANGVLLSLERFGPAAVVSGLLLVGTLLNQFTSPYAVAALLTPIALAAADALGAPDARPFLLAIAFAGSNAFATPMGHQVNLMVLGPGGYRYSDFLRVGLPMCFFYWLFASVGLALML